MKATDEILDVGAHVYDGLSPSDIGDIEELAGRRDVGQGSDRTAAMNRLRAGIAKMSFSSSGPLPSRDELHGRS